jgi:hypothetical protein
MVNMHFRDWLLEVGGTGGVGGGLTPPTENPLISAAALSDYHDPESSDSRNTQGMLPPVKKAMRGLNKKNGKHSGKGRF